MVIITGGSSVGTLDLTLDVLQTFAGTELLIHGVSVRPGKPTLIADVDGKPFLGLPGHPVSAMVVFHLFGKLLLKILSGLSKEERFSPEEHQGKGIQEHSLRGGKRRLCESEARRKAGNRLGSSPLRKVGGHCSSRPSRRIAQNRNQ